MNASSCTQLSISKATKKGHGWTQDLVLKIEIVLPSKLTWFAGKREKKKIQQFFNRNLELEIKTRFETKLDAHVA